MNQEQVNKYECILYTLPIVQKSSFILERIIEINEEAVNYIRDNGKPFYLLNLAEQKDIGALPEPLQKYLERIGEEKVRDVELKRCV